MFDKMTNKKNLPILGMAVAFVVLILTLFVFQLGVEDNGSLGPRLEQMGLYDVSQASGSGFYSQHFGVSDKSISTQPSMFIYTLCKQFFGIDTVMNSMVPCAIFVIIYILGLYMLLKVLMTDIKWSNILTTIICLLVLCDSAYTAYFNTPYSYASVLAFSPLFCASVINAAKSKNIWWTIVSALCGIFVFGSHAVAAVAGVVFFAYFIYIMIRKKEVLSRLICVLCALVIAVSSTLCFISTDFENKYNSVFYGALLENPEGADEMELTEYKDFSGVPSFEPQAQTLIKSGNLDSKISYSKIIAFYLKNPSKLFDNIKTAANNGTMIKTPYLGSYAPSSGKSAGETAGVFSLYSTLKARFVPNSLLVLLAGLVLILYFSIVYRNKYAHNFESKICSELSGISAFVSIIMLVTVVILFGVTQISFNMFVFNLFFDYSIISVVVGGTKLLWLRRQILKEKYGVNQ